MDRDNIIVPTAKMMAAAPAMADARGLDGIILAVGEQGGLLSPFVLLL